METNTYQSKHYIRLRVYYGCVLARVTAAHFAKTRLFPVSMLEVRYVTLQEVTDGGYRVAEVCEHRRAVRSHFCLDPQEMQLFKKHS